MNGEVGKEVSNPFVIEVSEKSFEEAVEQVGLAARKFGFNVVHIHEMHKTFEKNGMSHPPYSIIELCNPQKAFGALTKDLRMGNMMPKHVVVFVDKEGRTSLMIMKTDPAKLDQWFPGLGIGDLSRTVMDTLTQIIRDAK